MCAPVSMAKTPHSQERLVELLSTSVGIRTKWNRTTRKRLARKGYVARLFYRNASGKRVERSKEFQTRRGAEDYVRDRQNRFKTAGGRAVNAERMTFNDLARHYEEHYAKEAEYVGERKVSGLRSIKPVLGYIQTLHDRFGDMKLSAITYGDIRGFRADRLKTPVMKVIKIQVPLTPKEREEVGGRKRYRYQNETHKTPRCVASVNRELMTLRRMLNVAVTEGWLLRNPINAGPSLINMSDERMRTRVLSVEEEEQLLCACNVPERLHLRALVICLLDSGLRLNEALTLTWANVDLDNGVIHVTAFNSKTARPKSLPISRRLAQELTRLREERNTFHDVLKGKEKDGLVFGIKNNVNRSWRTAKRLANLQDLRLHDLRHTFGTRMDRKGFTQAQIARLLGHQQVHTTYRYTNPDKELLEDVRAVLDAS